jgi:hypothetical protein
MLSSLRLDGYRSGRSRPIPIETAALTYHAADLNDIRRLSFAILFCGLFFNVGRTVRLLGFAFIAPSNLSHSNSISKGG